MQKFFGDGVSDLNQMASNFLVSGGFLCKACHGVKVESERCPEFAKWGTDLCHACCDAANDLISHEDAKSKELLLLQGQVSFYRSLWLETGTEAYYDIMALAEETLYFLRNGIEPP